MTNIPAAGHEEVQHTADVAIRVWAPTLACLFVEAALGMNAIAEVKTDTRNYCERKINVRGQDNEALLVAFLSELLFILEQEGILFDLFDIRIRKNSIRATARGASVLSIGKSIKAVTYHDLLISKTASGYETKLVFDV